MGLSIVSLAISIACTLTLFVLFIYYFVRYIKFNRLRELFPGLSDEQIVEQVKTQQPLVQAVMELFPEGFSEAAAAKLIAERCFSGAEEHD